MAALKKLKHPMQPIGRDEDGTLRFKPNQIIVYLRESGKLNLNDIACMPFSAADREQLAQLLGYSTSGFFELSYVRSKTLKSVERAIDFETNKE